MPPATQPSLRRSRWAGLLLAAALQCLFLVALQSALDGAWHRHPASRAEPSDVVHLSLPALPEETPRMASPTSQKGLRNSEALLPLRQRSSPTSQPVAQPSSPAQAVTNEAAIVAAPAASEAASTPLASLLDSPGSKRAIREAGRQMSIAERAALASEAPRSLSAQERLGRDVANGALGDCLKGQYAGGGMGLLSLPFFVLAEARGKCAQ